MTRIKPQKFAVQVEFNPPISIRVTTTQLTLIHSKILDSMTFLSTGFSLLCENGCMYREDMVLPSQTLFKQLLYSFLREGGIQLQDV